MTVPKLYFCPLYHGYQPVTIERERLLAFPWARQHAADYDAMVRYALGSKEARIAIHLAPVLMETIARYTREGWSDPVLELTRVRAEELTQQQKEEILRDFFDVHSKMMEPFPLYNILKMKRGEDLSAEGLKAAAKRFTTEDFRALQVLYNLVWLMSGRKNDSVLAPLVVKASTAAAVYTEEDKETVLRKNDGIMRGLLGLYKEAQDAGVIEVPLVPYYHPVLPLLIDTGTATEASPGLVVPAYLYPEDARAQIEKGRSLYQAVFEREPRGMWPSEGGVSHALFDLVGTHFPGIKWLATGGETAAKETTLGRSLKRDPGLDKYYPWLVGRSGVSVVFRDEGFSYTHAFRYEEDPARGAVDILFHLERMAHDLPAGMQPPLVMLMGDAENMQCSRSYQAEFFFRTLYLGLEYLAAQGLVAMITPSAYLEKYPSSRVLEHLVPGSWVSGNFNRWIGNHRANRMWGHLAAVRRLLADTKEKIDMGAWERAYQNLLQAQTSCFFWWLDNVEGYDKGKERMDELQRSLIAQVYEFCGKPIPPDLFRSSYA